MRVPTAIAGSRGRLTLPEALPHRLRVKTGDKLNFELQMDGAVIVSVALSTTGASSRLLKQGSYREKGA
jgi:hypothetical protein